MSDIKIEIYQPNECVTLIHGAKKFLLTLDESREALSRISDIKLVNSATYPELVGVFTAGYYELCKATGHLKTELTYIDHSLELLRAQLLTDADKVPRWLSEQSLKDTADVKNALITKYPAYSKLLLTREEFKVKIEELESQIRVLNSALYSIKEISHQRSTFNYRSNQELNIPDEATLGTTVRRKFTSEF